MTRSQRRLAGTAAVGALVVVGLAIRFGPALALVGGLAGPTAAPGVDGLGPEPGREEVTLPVGTGSLAADLYRPARPRGAMVLVHGLSRAGRRHPELTRLARLLARHGQTVLVPHFDGLAGLRLTGREVEEITAALRHLAGMGGRVGIAGFSFGAGPALIAAARVPDLRVAGSFGGYADLRHVITYVTTGVHAFGGRRYVGRQEAYNRWKLLALLAGLVANPRDRPLLEAVAERRLAGPSEDTGGLEAALGSEGQAVLALVLNDREERVTPLLARLPPDARSALDRLSPVQVVSRLPGRLLIAHGADDDSIPFTESLRLAEAAGGTARIAILRTFHHTGPRPLWGALGQRAADGWHLFRLVDDLLTAA